MALLLFVCLAGAQPSVVLAVLIAAMALLISEAGHHNRLVGVLMLTLSGMLLLRPGLVPIDWFSTQCGCHRWADPDGTSP